MDVLPSTMLPTRRAIDTGAPGEKKQAAHVAKPSMAPAIAQRYHSSNSSPAAPPDPGHAMILEPLVKSLADVAKAMAKIHGPAHACEPEQEESDRRGCLAKDVWQNIHEFLVTVNFFTVSCVFSR